MIQRIQTIWLSIAAILSVFLLTGDLLWFTTGKQEILTLGFTGLSSVNGAASQVISNSVLLVVLLIMMPALSVVAIFLYRKRPIQKGVVIALMLTSLLLILTEGYYWNLISDKYNGVLLPGIRMVIPLVIIILAILAWLGIRKDDNIVKSYDRLR